MDGGRGPVTWDQNLTEPLVTCYQTTRHLIPEGSMRPSPWHEHLRFHML